MKKITLLFTTIILLISCSQSPEKIKEDINEKHLSQAQTFIQSKINKSWIQVINATSWLNNNLSITNIGFS